MRIEIVAPESIKSSETCNLRVLLFNDSYEPTPISRNAFVGPNLRGLTSVGFPHPKSVEPTFGEQDEPLMLQPFTFYGRERTYNDLQPGEVEVTAYYRPGDSGEELSVSARILIEAS